MSGFKIIALSGSLRKKSFNTAALRAAQEVAPQGVTIEIAELGDLPLYNDDIRENAYPESVMRLRRQIAEADAVLFATPEYNYAVAAPLKNAFDWCSRPPEQPLNNKAVAILSASMGPLGGVRAQYNLRHMFVSTNSFCVNTPQVVIGSAQTKFDENGKFTDQVGRDLLKQLIEALVALSRRLNPKA
ncbi:MAG: NAD(P)H-dependent oxidoreductase [Alphaproteobacteria bacterium]|nr:NAD(P)H-dependent oxidoreductase [Alphaproteobacteria bacterium]